MSDCDLIYFNSTNLQSLNDEVELLRALFNSHGHLIKAEQKLKFQYLLYKQSYRLTKKDLIVHKNEEENKGGAQIQAEIGAINAELACYAEAGLSLDENNQYYLNLAGVFIPLPRSSYLSSRLKVLKSANKAQQRQSEQTISKTKLILLAEKIHAPMLKVFSNTIYQHFYAAYSIAKKIIDLVDDIFTPIINKSIKDIATANIASAIVIGITSGIIHATEFIIGIYTAIKAFAKKETSIRKTKIASGSLVAVITGTGLALCAVDLASSTGIAVAGSAFLPAVIPALLVIAFAITLWRHAYKLHHVKSEMTRLKERNNLLSADIALLEQKNKKLARNRATLHAGNQTATPATLKSNALLMINSYKKQADNIKKLADLNKELVKNELALEKLEVSRRKAEREVAFKSVEIVAATIVLASAILGTAAIVGAASVASFGFLPLALCIAGVAIGVTLKFLEWRDKKNGHIYSNGIISKLKDGWNSLFSCGKENQPSVSFSIGKTNNAHAYKKLNSTPKSAPQPALTKPCVRVEQRLPPLYTPAMLLASPAPASNSGAAKPDRSPTFYANH